MLYRLSYLNSRMSFHKMESLMTQNTNPSPQAKPQDQKQPEIVKPGQEAAKPAQASENKA